ncbi:hypothetical protein [Pseudorhodoplanes sp.]|uniref:hypothetical protein n=1 Tax=Pseudorhodoplanes sp. TaxID=1934341 RepID=UPI003D14B9E3
MNPPLARWSERSMTARVAARDVNRRGIDFGRSSCTWLLRDEDSRGTFALDAVLAIGPSEAPIERYVLTAQVFAGNVYAGSGLFKLPPYGYSAAFSETRFRIFRDPVHGQAGGGDSVGMHSDLFRLVSIDLHSCPCREVQADELISGAVAPMRLLARIDIAEGPGYPAHSLEFPVRHINRDAPRGRFQVETGPVLSLEAGMAGLPGLLRRAYVMFGALDRAELLLDTPRNVDAAQRWSSSISLRCKVTIFQLQA